MIQLDLSKGCECRKLLEILSLCLKQKTKNDTKQTEIPSAAIATRLRQIRVAYNNFVTKTKARI